MRRAGGAGREVFFVESMPRVGEIIHKLIKDCTEKEKGRAKVRRGCLRRSGKRFGEPRWHVLACKLLLQVAVNCYLLSVPASK